MRSGNGSNTNSHNHGTEVTSTVANSPFRLMHIIAIAWLYVVVMIAAVSDSILKGVVRLLFLGVLPVGLMMWMSMRRHRNRMERDAEQSAPTRPEPSDSSQ